MVFNSPGFRGNYYFWSMKKLLSLLVFIVIVSCEREYSTPETMDARNFIGTWEILSEDLLNDWTGTSDRSLGYNYIRLSEDSITARYGTGNLIDAPFHHRVEYKSDSIIVFHRKEENFTFDSLALLIIPTDLNTFTYQFRDSGDFRNADLRFNVDVKKIN